MGLESPTGRKTRARLLSIVIALGFCGPAVADCAVCTPSVRFDEALASCFEQSVADDLAQVRGGQPVVMVNLGACAEEAGTRGDTLPKGGEQSLDFAFVTDEAGLVCLQSKLAAAKRPLDPAALFALDAACQ